MLLQAQPDCTVVAENVARILNRGVVNEAEVIAEWQEICGENDRLTLYRVAANLDAVDIQSPVINWHLWMIITNKQLHRSTTYKNPELNAFLSRRASSSSPNAVDGKLLKTYFTHGKSAFLSELRRTKGGKLHEFAKRSHELRQSDMSMILAMNAGAWLPSGNLSRLGSHPTLGFLFAIGLGDWAFGMAMDFRFLNTPSEYLYFDPNTNGVRPTRSFFALLLGFDVRWEFLKAGQFSMLAAGALGYDLISHRAAPRYSGLRPAFSDSLNLNGGLVLRYYFSDERAGFAEIDARVHRVTYDSTGQGGDDLSGSYFTLLLAAGYRLNFDD